MYIYHYNSSKLKKMHTPLFSFLLLWLENSAQGELGHIQDGRAFVSLSPRVELLSSPTIRNTHFRLSEQDINTLS